MAKFVTQIIVYPRRVAISLMSLFCLASILSKRMALAHGQHFTACPTFATLPSSTWQHSTNRRGAVLPVRQSHFWFLAASADNQKSHSNTPSPNVPPKVNDSSSSSSFQNNTGYPQSPKRFLSTSSSFSMNEDSTWNVPKRLEIPEDQLEISFARSSGAGGQNVNKVNTKVDIRLHVLNADWIPNEVRQRLVQQQGHRINKDGYLVLSCQEYRTQAQNRKAALAKLEQIVLEAWPRPKIRKQRTGISKASKERNKEFKRQRSEVKKNRKRIDW